MNANLSPSHIYENLKSKYYQYAPDFELKIKSEQIAKLNSLTKKKNAVILKHNYMTWDLQCDEVIGIRGDSLELSKRASQTEANIILFLGVKFMAETAKILNPYKKVLIPSLKAGCSLASSIHGSDVRQLKKMFPGVPVVAYVNTDADTKSEVDVCCASGNAQKVAKWAMEHWHTDKVIFLPDKFLAQNIASNMNADIYFPDTSLDESKYPIIREQVYKKQTNKPLFIGWPGQCEVHNKFTPQDVDNLKKEFPGVYIMAHPECPPNVVKRVHFSGSTGDMIRQIDQPDVQDRQVAFFTECAMVEMLAAKHQNVLQVCSIQKRCPHMAQNNLETVISALENEEFEINVPEEIRSKAEVPIRRMVNVT